MASIKISRGPSAPVLAFLALLAVPALLWGDPKDKKPAPQPQAKPAAPAPKAAATTGHPASPTGTPQSGRSGGPTGTGGHSPGTKTSVPQATKSVPQVAKPGALRPAETRNVPGVGTATVVRHANGGPATIRTKGMTISHPLHGPATVVKEGANGRKIVATGRHGGYVEHPYFSRGGRTYVQRTYVVGGKSYVSVYRSYTYGGVAYYGYAPAYYYQPAYYGWAYNPWSAPVVYGPAAWGWAGASWYGYYPGYFAPYPAYAGASEWLTDYLLAANLQAAYADAAQAKAGAAEAPSAGAGAPAAAAGQTALSPEVKQMIAEEVKNQLAAAKSAAGSKGAAPTSSQSQLPDALNPAERIFVVSSSLDVANAAGKECGLAPGDVVMRMTDTPDDNQNVTASVQSSKKADCAAGQTVSIGVQDLQEMHNQFRQQLDSGLQTLASNAGKGGLPQAPDTSTIGGEVSAPMPDQTAADQLRSAQQEGEAVENAVQTGAAGG
jgi:hypothetical protein